MSQLSSISSALATDQYLQLLVTQLQNQDPLDPVSDKEFIAQLSQLSSLQSLQSLDANFSEVLKLQQLTSGSALVGKTVTFSGDDGNDATGRVSAVTVADKKISLTVDTPATATVPAGTASIGLDKVKSAS